MIVLNFILVSTVAFSAAQANGQEFVKPEKSNKIYSQTEEKFPFDNEYYKEHYYQPYFQEAVGADVNSAENYVKFPPHKASKVLLSVPSIFGWYAGPKSTLEPLEETVSEEPVPESSTDNQDDKKTNMVRYNNAVMMKEQRPVSSEYESENEGWLAESYEQLPLEVTEKQLSNDASNKTSTNVKALLLTMPPSLNPDFVAATDPINQFLNLKLDTPRDEIEKILSKIQLENLPDKYKLKFILKLAELKYSMKITKLDSKRDSPNANLGTTLTNGENRKVIAEKKANDEPSDDKAETLEDKENTKNNNITIISENSEKYTIQNGSETIVLETKHSMITSKYKINEKPKTVKSKESKKNKLKEKLIETLKKKLNDINQTKNKEKAEEAQPNLENNVNNDLNVSSIKKKTNKTSNQTVGKRDGGFLRFAIPELRQKEMVNLPIGYEMGPPFMFQPPKSKDFYAISEPEKIQKKNQEGKKYKFLKWIDA